jgi:hypothetical protein
MEDRTIKSTAKNKSQQVLSLLNSIFALELFSPSEEIYLYSPWVTDIHLLDTAYGQFRSVLPETESTQARLSTLLNTLESRGTEVYIIARPSSGSRNYTDTFINRLDEKIHVKHIEDFHEKSLVTEHFYFRGSMNFTYSGIYRNKEHIELSTNPAKIAQARVNAKQIWKAL